MDDDHRSDLDRPVVAPQSGAAERALAEAKERREAAKRAPLTAKPREVNGRQGPEPVRYGDWENKGIAYDF